MRFGISQRSFGNPFSDGEKGALDPLPTLWAALGTSVLQQERSYTLWYEMPYDPANLVKFCLRLPQ